LEKRKGKKAAAEKYEPIKAHFPGADFPLAVAQIDHTPMDVIVAMRNTVSRFSDRP
jgi:putative transposase